MKMKPKSVNYPYMLDKPEYSERNAKFIMGGNKEDIRNNIAYLEKYEYLIDKSTRYGINTFALLLGLAGTSLAVVGKRRLV